MAVAIGPRTSRAPRPAKVACGKTPKPVTGAKGVGLRVSARPGVIAVSIAQRSGKTCAAAAPRQPV